MEREEETRISKTEKLTLPPNQLHLANKLTELGKRVVVILLTDHAPDIEFTRPFEGVVVASTEVKYSALALVKILSGEYAPTGKLAYTFYSGTEHAFAKARAYMNSGMKTGPFIGYRYYDTADMRVGYPFGHGLTYTEFKYSGLKLSGSKISFTVKNVGNVAGTETAQIYAGKNTSSLLRPQKELCGFAKIELAPHQKKRIVLDINLPKVYDQEDFVTEKGLYTIYVGSSVSDIRLKCEYFAMGKELTPDGEQWSDYLQTYSNILEGKYTLEANYIFMKKSIQNMLIGIGATALAISIAVFNATTNASSLFLGIVSGILALIAVTFFILHAIEKNKECLKERESLDEENKAYFDDAEKIPVISTELMFRENFDMVNDDAKEEKKSLDFETAHWDRSY